MVIPEENHPNWAKVISGQLSKNFEFLATKIIIGRLALNYKLNSTSEELKKCIQELRIFFQKHEQMPKAQADLKKIFE